jgi:hypothetical protein
MIEARDLTKIYAGKAAVDHLTFTVGPGQVTGFLGPNGTGKSTTMRPPPPWPRPTSSRSCPPCAPPALAPPTCSARNNRGSARLLSA